MKAFKTGVAVVGVIAVVVVLNAVNDAYCAWEPDTLIGKLVKWQQWDPRRC